MTEQELRGEFEKWAKEVNVSRYNEVYFVIFKSGYVLAQETIKAKDADSNKWYREWYNEHEKLLKVTASAKYLISKIPNWEGIPLPYKEKAKAWLEQNK